jgi:carbon storage regulator CsrA
VLILSRRPNESICFPNLGISVRILGVQGTRVRIGVDAPNDVNVLRGELYDAEMQSSSTNVEYGTSSFSSQRNSKFRAATSDLRAARELMQAGQLGLAEQTLVRAIEQLERLEVRESAGSPSSEMQVSESASSYSLRRQRIEASPSTTRMTVNADREPWYCTPVQTERSKNRYRESNANCVSSIA